MSGSVISRRCARLLVLSVFVFSCQSNPDPADLVISGGKIYTVNKDQPIADAVAVIGDSIVYVGSREKVDAYIGKNTKVIDLKGRTMIPGLIEGHGHLMGLGYNEFNLDLMNTTSYEQIVAEVKRAVGRSSPGQWIIGRGWHQDKWVEKPDRVIKGFPTHDLLSSVSPNNPVYLTHASGHVGLANAKAMELAGVYKIAPEKKKAGTMDSGEIILDPQGNPTGIFNEQAQGLITRIIPQNSKERNTEALAQAISACQKNGITSFHDAGVPQEFIDLYQEFKANGRLGVRLYVMIDGSDRGMFYRWIKSGPAIDHTHWLTVRSIKLVCDGALGSRGAWLLDPYSDRPGHFGHETMSMDTVLKTSVLALQHDFQVCSHAIGDRANREVLDQYEKAMQSTGIALADHRFRIEHAQHLSPQDIPRFAGLGVTPSMQAIHLSSDRPWAIDRLGEKRIREGAYVWQDLLQTGVRIINGTDTPVEPINPIACFYAAVTRRTLAGDPPGGFEPKQKMTREQALRSYTLDAAYGAFEDKIKGSVEVGKLADFVILSQDIMTIDENDILSTQVVVTILDGEVVFQR
jgi:predicted amidohydrolase YtcJ